MPFTFTKVSNYGTTHPVVARLSLQMAELVKWSSIDEIKQKEFLTECFEMKNRLLKCFELWNTIEQAIETTLTEHLKQLQKPSAEKRVRYVPYAIDVAHNAELYLYQASNFMRDLALLLNMFFGTNFRSAKDFYHTTPVKLGKIPKWFASKFGSNDPIAQMLRENQI